MSPKQFFDKVVHLRKLQKEYLRTRSSIILRNCKIIEKEIDDEITRVNRTISDQQQQLKLF